MTSGKAAHQFYVSLEMYELCCLKKRLVRVTGIMLKNVWSGPLLQLPEPSLQRKAILPPYACQVSGQYSRNPQNNY
jgi:hypothetical protein